MIPSHEMVWYSFPWSPYGVDVRKDNKARETGKTLPMKRSPDVLLYKQIISRTSLKAASSNLFCQANFASDVAYR